MSSARLQGKVALISGAARGQGAAAARRLVADGARVVVGDILDGEGKELVEELDGSARYVHLDVTDEGRWGQAVAAAEEAFGRLDVLVNNAGVLAFGKIAEQSTEEYRRIIEVNQVGVFAGMRAVIPAMRRAGGGSIVNISSVEGLGGTANCAAYTASKFAVRGMTKTAALELGKYGIRVNSVHPGGIDTAMLREQAGEEALDYIASLVPGLRRVGQPEEVAATVAFLASDDSSYCTGSELAVDGGATATAGFG